MSNTKSSIASPRGVAAAERLFSDFQPHSYEAWRKLAEESLKGAPFEKRLVSRTWEGIDLQPIYRARDAAGLPGTDTPPGFEPYLRGTRSLGHRITPWKICQELSCGLPRDFNQAMRRGLERGQTAIHLSLDRAAQMGLDPDAALPGDVGTGGVSIATVRDLVRALEGMDLEKTPIFIQGGASALPMLAMLLALLRQQGRHPAKLRGGIALDPLGELVREGMLAVSLEGAWRDMTAMAGWAAKNAPGFRTVAVQTPVYHDAGAHAVQELAFALATGVVYLRQMMARGLGVDQAAAQMRFSFSIGSQYFMEIAKLRAARLLWAGTVRAFGGDAAAQKMEIHARTSLWNKTVCDPYVNMLRATAEAFAAALGGCDSLHVGAFDEVIRPSDEFSQRMARNTQIILQKECHFDQVADPAGGSWHVESLTDSLAHRAWALFQEIEKRGGMETALRDGFPQEQVAKVAQERRSALAKRKEVLVGANMYANLKEKPLEAPAPSPGELQRQRAHQVAEDRAASDSTSKKTALEKMAHTLETPDVMGAAVEAAFGGATLGEITRVLRAKDGARPPVTPLRAERPALLFELLRAASDAHRAATGARPKVFLANMGPVKQHKARADFSRGFFEVGGFEVLNNKGFPNAEEAAKAALASGATLMVVCSTDETYPEIVPPFVKAVKQARPGAQVILAGRPKELVESLRQAGVDEFIYLGADCAEMLRGFQKKLGMA